MKQDGQSGVDSVYAVTGVTTGQDSSKTKKTDEKTIKDLKTTDKNAAINEVYAWNQLEGQKASCTGNIYGVYDLSGGYWERIPAYIAQGKQQNLKQNGKSVAYNNDNIKLTSTKYTTVYPFAEEIDKNPGTDMYLKSPENYATNTKIFGDAVRETSIEGVGTTAWYNQDSYYPAWWYQFFNRGGDILETNKWSGTSAISGSGIFAYTRANGFADFNFGFRVVLVSK